MLNYKSIKILVISMCFIFLATACGRIEMEINDDYSGKIKYYLEKNSLINTSKIKEELKKSTEKLNKKLGKEVYKVESVKEINNEIEVLLAFIAFDKYKDLNFKKYKNEEKNSGYENVTDIKNFYCGPYQDYFDYSDDNNVIENLLDVKTKQYINLLEIKNKRNVGILKINGSAFDSLRNLKVSLPGNVKCHSSNVNLINENEVNIVGGDAVIIFENNLNLLKFIYIILSLMLISIFILIIIKIRNKICSKCFTPYKKGSLFCGNCGEKAIKYNFQKVNKIVLFSPIGIVLFMLGIFVVNLILSSNVLSGNLSKKEIIDSLNYREISKKGSDNKYLIQKKDIVNLYINSSKKENNGIYKSTGNLKFKSNNFDIQSDVEIKHVYIPGSGWKCASITPSNLKLNPYSGPDKEAIKKALNESIINLDGLNEDDDDYSSRNNYTLIANKLKIDIINRNKNIKDGQDNVKIAAKINSVINFINLKMDCKFKFNEELEAWELRNNKVDKESISYEYKNKYIKSAPTSNENKLKEQLKDNAISFQIGLLGHRYKTFYPEGFKKFKIEKMEYEDAGKSAFYNIDVEYDDEECNSITKWELKINFNIEDRWEYTLETEKEPTFKVTTKNEIILSLEDQGKVDGKEIKFAEGQPSDLKIISRSGTDPEEVEVSFTYSTKMVRFKLEFTDGLFGYSCTSVEQIQ